MYQFSAKSEQKKIQLFKNLVAFQFLRRFTTKFQNGPISKIFFSKCSLGFNELGGIGFKVLFGITNPPEALKCEKKVIFFIFLDFF